MKQRLFILLGLFVLIIALIGLNAASFVQKEKEPDNEFNPNRSTYNTGATGTRAFFDLLAETGRKPVRWQLPPLELQNSSKNRPNVFVIIGPIRREFADNEVRQILDWVAEGGKLVLIDRYPDPEILQTTANWKISFAPDVENNPLTVDPSNQVQMTDKINAAKPVQPSIYTANVNAVQPSRFASSVVIERYENAPSEKENTGNKPFNINTPTPKPANSNKNKPYPMPKPAEQTAENEDFINLAAPVLHLSNDKKVLLADFPFGNGQIVFLTDPYIVSNAGIGLVDNAQIGINIVNAGDGIIAFNEYHHGYGAQNNQLFAYFSGTPVIPIFLQCVALIGLILFSQSRRFARPVPEPEPNRLSKLEYVSAMAELQQRIKGYDLAIENIYNDFRRRVARLVGIDNFYSQNSKLAQLIAERLPDENPTEIKEIMQKCEYISQGEPTSKKEILHLTKRLRELEEKLGLLRRKKKKKISS